jgi:uncharacterized membrane protein
MVVGTISQAAVALGAALQSTVLRLSSAQIWGAIAIGAGAALLGALGLWALGRVRAGLLRAWARLRTRHYHWRERRKWSQKSGPERQ